MSEIPAWMRDLPEGSMRVSGFTDKRPKVTVAVADDGMPSGQQWVVKGGDYPCVAHVPADRWVVVYSPADPAPQLDEDRGRGLMSDDYPASDPVGTVRVFPRWQDENHPREFAIRWCNPIDRDEQYPWLILDSEGPQRLTNDSVEGCERITFEQATAELAAGTTEREQPDVTTASLKKEEGSVFPNLGPLNREAP